MDSECVDHMDYLSVLFWLLKWGQRKEGYKP